MKNRKWQRVLSWLLTLTMLLGTFESNILAVNAMDDEAIEADAEIDEEEVDTADEDVEEPEVVGAAGDKSIDAAVTIYEKYGEAITNKTVTAKVVSANGTTENDYANVEWKLYKADGTTETVLPAGLVGTADGAKYTISGTPAQAMAATEYKLFALDTADNNKKIGPCTVTISIAELTGINVPTSDVEFGAAKKGYTVNAGASAQNNVQAKEITISSNSAIAVADITVSLSKNEAFELSNISTGNLDKNNSFKFSVAPKTTLVAKNGSTTYEDYIIVESSAFASKKVAKVTFTVETDLNATVSQNGKAATADLGTVSAGSAISDITFTATGGEGDLEWSVSGNLPEGVTADPVGNVLTVAGTPKLTENGKSFTFYPTVKDQKNSTEGNNKKELGAYTITVGPAAVDVTVGGEKVSEVSKMLNSNYLQAETALEITVTNNSDVEVSVEGALDKNIFNINGKQAKTEKLAKGASATFTILANTNLPNGSSVNVTFTGIGIDTTTVKYTLIVGDDLIITKPVSDNTALDQATVGKAYSYTFEAKKAANNTAAVSWNALNVSANGAVATLADYGLALSKDGKLTGTPKKVGELSFTISANQGAAVSSNDVTLKIVSTNAAITLTANGVELSDKDATVSKNGAALVLPEVATNLDSVKGVSANVTVANATAVDLGNVVAEIDGSCQKYDAAQKKYVDVTYSVFEIVGNGVVSVNASGTGTFTIQPVVTVISGTQDVAGSYRAKIKVNSNDNIVAKYFYVTIDVKNSPVIKDFTANTDFYSDANTISGDKVLVNKAISGNSVSFSAVSKNVADAKELKNVSWSWTASANSSIPEGLELSEAGIVTGTPTQAGEYKVVVTVNDNDTQTSNSKVVTIVVKASGSIDIKDSGDNELNKTTQVFEGAIKGGAIAASNKVVVTVKNPGTAAVKNLKISVKPANVSDNKSAAHFALSTTAIAEIAAKEAAQFIVTPSNTDEAGIFDAIVTISSNEIDAKSFEVKFAVVDQLTIAEVPADTAEVGQDYKITVSAASISYNKTAPKIDWTITQVSQNGVKIAEILTDTGNSINRSYVFGESGTFYYVVSANIANDDTLKVPANKAEAKVTINVSKSASVNVSDATSEAGEYSKGTSTSANNAIASFAFADRAEGYAAAGATEIATFTVSNNAKSALTVSANSSSTNFKVDGALKAATSIAAGGSNTFTVAPKAGLAAGTYTADIVVSGAQIVPYTVTVSFTVEAAKDAISLSANDATVGDEGITLVAAKKGSTTLEATTVSINNIGNVSINTVKVVEVVDETGKEYAIGATNQKLNVSALSGTGVVPGKNVNFTVAPKSAATVGEHTAYIKVTYAVGTTIKDPVIYKVNYTIYKDSVSVNVTPSANTVSINGTASVSENYSTAYSVGFSVANGEAGVAGDTTETLYDLRVALTGADADKFVLTADKVNDVFGADKVVKGASYSFNIAAKSGLSYGVYKATLEVSASNMTTITKEIVFTVTGRATSFTTDATSAGVSVNVAVDAQRLYNTLAADKGVTYDANKNSFTVSNDIVVSFNAAKDKAVVYFDKDHTTNKPSLTVSAASINTANYVADNKYFYNTVTFNLFDIVTFDANGGSFNGKTDPVSVNVANGGKVAELPSVSKNNASLKAWMDKNLNEFTTATTVSQDIVLTASWSAHTYPASASGNKAGQIEWTWNGTASDNFAGTFVTIYCTDTDCPDKAASAIKLDATITVSGKDASCTKGEAKVYTATAAKDGNVYTDTQTVAGEEGLGHKWVVDASNPVWAEDYSSVSINKTCEAAYHTSEDGDKTVAIVTKNISFNGVDATCTTSGNGVYTATFTSEDDPAISENIVVSVNAAEVPALGHDYKVKAEWIDNGFENTPSVNAVLVCSRCEEVVSENLTVSVELVSENEAKKDYKAVVTYEDKTYESAIYSVMNHTEHSWSVSFNWTGTTSENAVVEAIATCANGGETVVLSPDVEKKVTSKNVTYTATVKDPDGKEWSEKYTVNLESGEGKVGGGEGIEIRDLEDSYLVTGAQIKPAITVWDLTRDVQLAESVDYKVTYGKNKAAGEGSVTVVGKGNYSGKNVTATFTIVDPVKEMDPEEAAALAAVKGAKIEKIDAATFTGSAIYPETISVKTKKDGTIVMKSNGDGTYDVEGEGKAVVVAVTNNIKAGKATVAVTGSDAKTVKKTFKINKADISTATIEASETVYAVKGATPEIKVTWKASEDADEIELVQGMDYKVKYDKAAKKVGTASFTITGKGNFAKKSAATSFEIKALDLSDIDEEAIAVNASVGMKAGKVKVTVVDGNGTVIPAKNYKVEVFQGEGEAALGAKDKLAEGDATIKITGTGNLTESVEKSIVVASSISKAKIKVNKNLVKTYTGEAITLDDEDFNNIDVTLKGTKLVYGTDFVVASYANNIKKGKMTVTIEGIGKYSGTKTFKVKIVPQEMKPAE